MYTFLFSWATRHRKNIVATKSTTPNNAALISGNVIEWARKRLGITHQQLAAELRSSVEPDDIVQWESEKSRPDFRKAQRPPLLLPVPSGIPSFAYLPRTASR